MDATALLRPDLLAGATIALGGGCPLDAPLAALGATTLALPASLVEDEAAGHVHAALATHGRIDALVHDLRPAFTAGGDDALRVALDPAWVTVRTLATVVFIADGRGGKITLIAPPPGADPAAHGVRAAAENLARTLSIEWARHGIRTVAVTPGVDTTDAQLAAVAAYLASPAGDYFSGARLALGEVALTA